jgi:hypothetical protein
MSLRINVYVRTPVRVVCRYTLRRACLPVSRGEQQGDAPATGFHELMVESACVADAGAGLVFSCG